MPILNNPWRFEPGDVVYVRRQAQLTGTVLDYCFVESQWPHYLVRCNVTGAEWRISQLELSSKPIAIKP